MKLVSTVEYPPSWRPTLVVITCCYAGHAAPMDGADGVCRAVVRFADLDLNAPQDVAELYRRIENAARKVCAEHVRDKDDCIRRAIANAVAKIDRPALTAFHGNRLAMESAGLFDTGIAE
jgi:UrcA family protein